MGLNLVKNEEGLSLTGAQKARDLNREFERLLALVCGCIQEFSLYDTAKIAVSISRSRRNGRAGTLAYVVPLRYVGGARERKGRRWGISGFYSYESAQVEREQPGALYIMTFLVPKFFSLKPRDRLETLVHELYHLHPSMRGDLRRFPPPHIHHGPTPAAYHRRVKELCSELLGAVPNLESHPLLALNEDQIGNFRARRFNIPKHSFKAKPFGFLFVLLFGFFSSLAHAARVPVVIIKPGSIRIDPQQNAAIEATIKRGDRFEASKLSDDHNWVWVFNSDVAGWVERDVIQSASLDRHLGLRNAYVDPTVPNKLGEKKVGDHSKDDDDTIENSKPLKSRKMVAATPPSSANEESSDADKALDDALMASDEPNSVAAAAKSTSTVSVPTSESVPAPSPLGTAQAPLKVSGTSSDAQAHSDLEEAPTSDQLAPVKINNDSGDDQLDGEKVSKAQVRAQSPLSPIRRNDFVFKNDKSGRDSADGAIMTWEATFDVDRDKSTVLVGGKLFERPNLTSRRYGILEKGDEALPLAHTSDGQWLRVRLQETGEEGWYPANSISIRQADRRATELLRNHIEPHFGWGTRGRGFGGGLGYHFLLSTDERNRYWSIGADFSAWSGQKLSFASASYTSKYLGFVIVGRYNIPSDSSNLTGYAEAGVGYYQALITTGGISQDVLTQNGLTAQASKSMVPVLGVGLKYGFLKHFDALMLVRMQLSSSSQVYTGLGLGGNF